MALQKSDVSGIPELPSVDWNYPTAIHFGVGRVADLPELCQIEGIRKPLLVTDPGLAESPIFDRVKTIFSTHKIDWTLFSNIKSNPTGRNVDDGVAACKAADCDGVIALGGGSVLDAAKAIALMVGQERPLWDFEDEGDNWARVKEEGILPTIAVPTTAGTGSEVGRVSVITDDVAQKKRLIFHPKVLPERVILDPELTVKLPPHLTAATGMDALSHNLEAFCSPSYHPLADGIAVEGIKRIKESLLVAYQEGGNITARANMLVASTMGATAFQKGLGAMHALAHPLGALYDAHHGLLNAVLMPYVLTTNRPAIEAKIERLGDYIGLQGGSGRMGFDRFLEWILQLRSDLNIPNTLDALGITADQSAKVAKMAVVDPSAASNPISLSGDEYEKLLLKAIAG